MRQRRTLNDRHAPILTDSKYGTEQRKSYTHKPVEKVEWKPKPYTRELFNHMFRGWN